ncbi:MAG TPA: hypothetical protein VGO09_03550 [Flavisolibacter sp.]|nr:hypothetical protein [Flavisolibacter sp.]
MQEDQQALPPEVKPPDLIEQRRDLVMQIKAIDAKMAGQKSQELLSPEVQALLVNGLRIAVPIAIPVNLEKKRD